MLLSVYALVALVSTTLAVPTSTHELKQASRADVVRRIKRGVRPRAPVPSGAGGAPATVRTSVRSDRSQVSYNRYYVGSGAILSANPIADEVIRDCPGNDPSRPSVYATYANTVSTADAAQRCVDLGWSQGTAGLQHVGVALWFDESDDLWHCRTTYNENNANDFTAVDANARPVYGYNI